MQARPNMPARTEVEMIALIVASCLALWLRELRRQQLRLVIHKAEEGYR